VNSSGNSLQMTGEMRVVCPSCGTPFRQPVFQIQKSKLLIVEGKDEEEFFGALIADLGLKELQVAGIGGKTKIRQNLKALVRRPSFSRVEVLGVVRDADTDPKGAFQSVRDALAAAQLPTLKKPLQPAKGHPRVNVMILPSSDRKGALEDLCLDAVAADPANNCVDEYFDCLHQKDLVSIKELPKAKVRVFLSSREDPTLPLGLAAMKGYWPFDHEAFRPLRQFLMSL
jgi:Protein of unknown function (DUF3226)